MYFSFQCKHLFYVSGVRKGAISYLNCFCSTRLPNIWIPTHLPTQVELFFNHSYYPGLAKWLLWPFVLEKKTTGFCSGLETRTVSRNCSSSLVPSLATCVETLATHPHTTFPCLLKSIDESWHCPSVTVCSLSFYEYHNKMILFT